MIFLIAARNIIRNKKNSAIIIFLIAVITFLFFAGNTIISQSGTGLREAYTNSLTGDIVIEKTGEVTMSLFGANAPHLEDFFLIETLPLYNNISAILDRAHGIESKTSIVSTGSRLKVLGESRFVYLTGVKSEEYFKMFPGINLEKGSFIPSGEYGIMINSRMAAAIEKDSGEALLIGMPVTLTSVGNAGFKIREAPLCGIFSYSSSSSALDNIAIADSETARVLASIRTASASVEVSDNTRLLLDDGLFDALFDGPDIDAEANANTLLSGGIEDYLEREHEEAVSTEEGGDWNFIIIKLKRGVNSAKMIKDLNKSISAFGVKAVNWRVAAGISAILVLALQMLFNAGVFVVCVAGVIAIVNILLIAVFKRTKEIGTLRALGASDNYIRLLLIAENCMLGFTGGILGIALGAAAFSVINRLNIVIGNSLIVDLLGVKFLHVTFLPFYAAVSAAFFFAVTFLSMLYPVETAVKIEPVIAVREG